MSDKLIGASPQNIHRLRSICYRCLLSKLEAIANRDVPRRARRTVHATYFFQPSRRDLIRLLPRFLHPRNAVKADFGVDIHRIAQEVVNPDDEESCPH
jgi:hypothetical protein